MIMFFVLAVLLLIRAVLWSSDNHPSRLKLVVGVLAFLFSVLICLTDGNWIFVVITFLLVFFFHFGLEAFIFCFPKKKDLWKILSLSLSIVAIFLLLTISINDYPESLLGQFFNLFCGLYPNINEKLVYDIVVIFVGLFLVIFEVNHLIRFVLGICHLPPTGKKAKPDEQTLARGKIIGYFERALIFTLVILNQIGAVGFVMAAKALARFKEMEKKEWAEYVLIGTLISTVLSFAISLLVRAFLK